jgi:hypothetical protein
MKVEVRCENCHKTFELDTSTLPKMNSIAAKASKDGMREVYVDCPHCHEETAVNVPIHEKK